MAETGGNVAGEDARGVAREYAGGIQQNDRMTAGGDRINNR